MEKICPAPPPSILKHNNNQFGAGRHISPGIVNITTTIAVNLVCDVVNGNFQIDLSKSSQAHQGYILYTFSSRDPPGYLIVSEPINPVYLRVHNPLLSRIHFKLTDQNNHIFDTKKQRDIYKSVREIVMRH